MKFKSVFKSALILLLLIIVTISLSAKFNYKNFYSNMSWKDLIKSGWANKAINFNNINTELISASIFYETNRIRSLNNLSPFKFSRALMLAAFIHSRDMVKRNFMGHYSPVQGRRTPSDRVKKYGKWKYTVGENVAPTFAVKYKLGTSFRPPSRNGGGIRYMNGREIPAHTYLSFARSLVNQWMNSPPHRRNILNPRFKVLGASAYFFYRGRYRIPMFKSTQVFAGGMNDEIATLLSPKADKPVKNSRSLSDDKTGSSNYSSSSSSAVWRNSMYARYNYRTFKNYSGARTSINFQRVNNALLGAAIFYATNVQRARYRRPLFKYSNVLYKAAYLHSSDMVKYNFFSRTSRVRGRSTPADRVRIFGKWYSTVGENIAYTFGIQYRAGTSFYPPSRPGGKIRYPNGKVIPPHTYWSFAKSVVNNWMNSPGHRRNILNSRFRRLGAAGYLFFRGRYKMPNFMCTQVFAGGTND